MAFQIVITEEASSHLEALSARDQRIVEAAILTQTTRQPDSPEPRDQATAAEPAGGVRAAGSRLSGAV